MRHLLVLLVFFWQTAHSQTISNWVFAHKDTNGTFYSYNPASLIKDGWPPNAVAVKIATVDANGKPGGYLQYEYNCREQSVKVNQSNFTSIAHEATSIRKLLMHGFCGVQQSDGFWFLSGASAEASQPNSVFLWYMDINSLKKIDADRIVFKAGSGVSNSNGSLYQLSFPAGTHEITMSCSDYTKATSRNNAGTMTELKITENSVIWAAQQLTCNGYFNVGAASLSSPTQATKSIDSAKEQCKELGFKHGTEGFGKCVLQLSK